MVCASCGSDSSTSSSCKSCGCTTQTTCRSCGSTCSSTCNCSTVIVDKGNTSCSSCNDCNNKSSSSSKCCCSSSSGCNTISLCSCSSPCGSTSSCSCSSSSKSCKIIDHNTSVSVTCSTCNNVTCSCSAPTKNTKKSKSKYNNVSSTTCNEPYVKAKIKEKKPSTRPVVFKATITPATSMKPEKVEFTVLRKNGLQTLQWPTFSGLVGGNGVSYLSVQQSISGIPSYTVSRTIGISLSGNPQVGLVELDPGSPDTIKFYFNVAKGGIGAIGDSFIIHGSNITWIVG